MDSIPVGPSYLDNIVFKKRNPIVLRSICLIFAIIVYGCMAIGAWAWTYNSANDGGVKTKRCLYGADSEGVCTFGIFISFVALLASILFLGAEFIIDKPTFVNYRRQYYFGELIFSGIWSGLFFICFCVLQTQWNNEEGEELSLIESAGAAGSVRSAIWFSFLSVPVWAGCTYMALQRYRVMKAEAEYSSDSGRRQSARPATINAPGASPVAGQTTITF